MQCFYLCFLSPRPQSQYKRHYNDTFPENNFPSSTSKRQFKHGNSHNISGRRSYNRGRGQRYYSSPNQRSYNGMQNYKT